MLRFPAVAGRSHSGPDVCRHVVPLLALMTLFLPPTVHGEQDDPSPIEALRAELAALKAEYAQRLAALEARLQALEATNTATGDGTVPPPTTSVTGPAGTLPVYGASTLSSKVFNPDVAVVGDFLGFASDSSGDSGEPAFEMHEVELSLQAVVDPFARADFFLAFSPEEGVEIEEGFISFPALPGGFAFKAGKMRAAFGKVNVTHNHYLPWADRPLVTRSLVGGGEGISDGGVSLSRLIPNPLFFLEATAEAYRGETADFVSTRIEDLTYVGRLRAYGDLSDSTNLDLGGSIAYGHNDAGFKTRLIGADATFRYRPLRRAIYRRFLARTELVWSQREEAEAVRDAFGWYAMAEYQLARRWFAGLRYGRSQHSRSPGPADEEASVLLTFRPSEFSQIRGQWRRTELGDGQQVNEGLLQFLFSIGAHGAHPF